jgi:hypothetical protein
VKFLAIGLMSFLGASIPALFTLAARRWRPTVEAGAETLRFGFPKLVIGVALGAGIAWLLFVNGLWLSHPPEPALIPLAIALDGVALLYLSCAWYVLRFAIITSPGGLDCRCPLRRRRLVPWAEVEHIEFDRSGQWFVIQARGGWTIRVHKWVAALSGFLAVCERYLPTAALERAESGYRVVGRPFPGPRSTGLGPES